MNPPPLTYFHPSEPRGRVEWKLGPLQDPSPGDSTGEALFLTVRHPLKLRVRWTVRFQQGVATNRPFVGPLTLAASFSFLPFGFLPASLSIYSKTSTPSLNKMGLIQCWGGVMQRRNDMYVMVQIKSLSSLEITVFRKKAQGRSHSCCDSLDAKESAADNMRDSSFWAKGLNVGSMGFSRNGGENSSLVGGRRFI